MRLPQALARLACKFLGHYVAEDVDWPMFTSSQVRERGRARCYRCGCGMKKQILKEWETDGVHEATRLVAYRWIEWPFEEQVADALMEEPVEWVAPAGGTGWAVPAPVAPPNRSVLR